MDGSWLLFSSHALWFFILNADSGTNNDEAPAQAPQIVTNLSTESAEWVELFVREMLSASNIDDAKARASRALEVLEKSIRERVTTEVAQSFQQVVNFLLQHRLFQMREFNLFYYLKQLFLFFFSFKFVVYVT